MSAKLCRSLQPMLQKRKRRKRWSQSSRTFNQNFTRFNQDMAKNSSNLLHRLHILVHYADSFPICHRVHHLDHLHWICRVHWWFSCGMLDLVCFIKGRGKNLSNGRRYRLHDSMLSLDFDSLLVPQENSTSRSTLQGSIKSPHRYSNDSVRAHLNFPLTHVLHCYFCPIYNFNSDGRKGHEHKKSWWNDTRELRTRWCNVCSQYCKHNRLYLVLSIYFRLSAFRHCW